MTPGSLSGGLSAGYALAPALPVQLETAHAVRSMSMWMGQLQNAIVL